MPAKISAVEFKRRVKCIHGAKLKIMGEYTSSGEKIAMKCCGCGHIWDAFPGSLINTKRGCPNCSYTEQQEENYRLFTVKLQSIHGNKIKILSKYINSSTKLKCGCSTCGSTWLATPNNLTDKVSGCAYCSGIRTRTDAEYKLELASKNIGLEAIGEYCGATTKIAHRCLECGHEWLRYPAGRASKKAKCPECYSKTRSRSQAKTQEQYLKEVRKAHGTKLVVLGIYVSAKTKIDHKCTSCLRVWATTPASVLSGNGHGCIACNSYRMKDYKLGRRIVRVQGFEPQALDWIQTNLKIPAKDIVVASSGKIPDILYTFNKKVRRHRPDLAVPKLNIVFEVKSTITFGLKKSHMSKGKPAQFFKQNCAKAKAAISQGIDYHMVVMESNGNIIKLPHAWYSMSLAQIREGI